METKKKRLAQQQVIIRLKDQKIAQQDETIRRLNRNAAQDEDLLRGYRSKTEAQHRQINLLSTAQDETTEQLRQARQENAMLHSANESLQNKLNESYSVRNEQAAEMAALRVNLESEAGDTARVAARQRAEFHTDLYMRNVQQAHIITQPDAPTTVTPGYELQLRGVHVRFKGQGDMGQLDIDENTNEFEFELENGWVTMVAGDNQRIDIVKAERTEA